MSEFYLNGSAFPWDPRVDSPACEACGGEGHPAYQCPERTPAPVGGWGLGHTCQNPTDPNCQGECAW